MNAATNIKVTKRDGRLEDINLDKIHRVVTWAAEGLQNVSVSQVELKSHIQFYNGIRTDDIHETIIKAAADLISQDTPDYQYLAARLAIFHLRKIAYGEFEPPHLYDHVKKTDRSRQIRPPHHRRLQPRRIRRAECLYRPQPRHDLLLCRRETAGRQISGSKPRYPPNL